MSTAVLTAPAALQWAERSGLQCDRLTRAIPLRNLELRARVNAAIATATCACGTDPREAPRAPGDVEAVLTLLEIVTDRALEIPRVRERRAAVSGLSAIYRDLCAYRTEQRAGLLTLMQQSLARLRQAQSVEELLENAPNEISRALGFDRVLVSQVEDAHWLPVSAYVRGDAAAGGALLAALGGEPEPLTHLTLECDILRRRSALLVHEAQDHPRMHPRLAAATGTRSYVAAPVMPEGEVVGFLHADFHGSGRHPDALDRDALFAFAEAFGALLQRRVLSDRLRAQSRLVRSTTAALGSQLDDLALERVRMTRQHRSRDVDAAMARVPEPCRGGRLESLLTKRELEVVELMATGARNRDIAARLVVTEGTVKSHVKQILRKMRATNRAEAVSKYMRIAALPAGDER